jgi:hypothetical protein
VNANLANVLACSVPRIAWLFALDLDERLSVDKRRLLRLDVAAEVVALRTWEGAASDTEDVHGWYKRWPTVAEMQALHRDGVLGRPDLKSYFRGHHGKRGLRPDVDKRVEMHRVRGRDRRPVKPFVARWLVVLHDESISFDTFRDKWAALLTAGDYGQGTARQGLGRMIRATFDDPVLGAAERETRLREIYRRHVVDDVAALRRRGLLVQPPFREYAPRPLTDEERAVLDGLCALLRRRPKLSFLAGFPRSRRRLERLLRRTSGDASLAVAHRGLRQALGHPEASARESASGQTRPLDPAG